jgi:hypothetical protein
MGHVTRETGWCNIDINTATGAVFLQERWLYQWLTTAALPAWTAAEKNGFHTSADRAIWAAWSNRAKLSATGTSDFARRLAGKKIPIDLDVRRVSANQHWTVRVTKIPAGTFRTSSVQWTARLINFDTEDFTTRNICSGTPQRCDTQVPVAHEFGHAVGNTVVLGRGDEYNAGTTNFADHQSIMHSGHRLRSRHFQTILYEMNRMIPNTVFSVASVS